nr:PAS domain-containing sensor histidine kinase [Candidatus Sigynarchaeota archaeon]
MVLKIVDLIQLVLDPQNEKKLIGKLLAYAKMGDYTKYTSTLEEAWEMSIRGITQCLVTTINKYKDQVPELNADEHYAKDPAAAFGILEAQRHRSRGVTLELFVGLMKYFRQSYLDLINESNFDVKDKDFYHLFVERFFDRLELGFISEWADSSYDKMFEELRDTNRKMTNEKNKYLTIFESLNAPAFLVNTQKNIESINNAALQTFGNGASHGRKYYDKKEENILNLPWLNGVLESFLQSHDSEKTIEREISTPMGTRIFEIKLKKMLDFSEKFSGITVLFNDLTERVEYDNLRKQFITMISHELRTPITVIDLSVKNLQKFDSELSSEQREKIIDVLGRSNKTLTHMVEDLLILSRVDSKQLKLSESNFNLGKMVRTIIVEFGMKCDGRAITLESQVPNDLEIFGDETHLAQVLRILLENAFNYSKENSTIRVIGKGNEQQEEIGKKGSVIEVVDTGIGIKEEDVSRIFDRFFRSDEVKMIIGTGLGLSIAKEIVELHGGTITVHSKYGEGTTFSIFLPDPESTQP